MSWRNLPNPGPASCSIIAAAVSRSPSSAWINAIALVVAGCGRAAAAQCGGRRLERSCSPRCHHTGNIWARRRCRRGGCRPAGPAAGLVGERLAVGEAALHDRPQRAELDRVGEQEGLVQPFGQLGMGVELPIGGGDVAILEQVGESPPDWPTPPARARWPRAPVSGIAPRRRDAARSCPAPLGVPPAVDRQRQCRLDHEAAGPSPRPPR